MRFSRPGLVLVSSLLLAGISPLPTVCPAMAGSPNGVAGSMPAYYDHDLFTINFKQMVTAQDILQAKNGQLNIIWQSDPGLPGGQPFISVINAIPADGMNPLWVECQIAFNAGHTPRQFFSDDEVHAAEKAGEITVTDTHELYRCSVIGVPSSVTGAASRSTTIAAARPASAAASATATGSPTPAAHSWGGLKASFR